MTTIPSFSVKHWIDTNCRGGQRYVTDAEFNNRFEGLRLRPSDCREHVEAVLRSEKNDAESQLLAVMIVIYPLRNNLFHGLKAIDTLNDQVPNLTMRLR